MAAAIQKTVKADVRNKKMKVYATKNNVEAWLDNQSMEAMAKRAAWSVFLRGLFWMTTLFLVFFIPIILTVFTNYFPFLLLWPILFVLWCRFCRIKATFDPKKQCPTCDHPLKIVEREEGEDLNYYLVCSWCDKEKLSYSIPPSSDLA